MNNSKPYRKLYRSRDERMIAGVCGGLGAYWNIDPVWIRLIFIVLFFAGGCALLVYLILWVIVPLAPKGRRRVAISGGRQIR